MNLRVFVCLLLCSICSPAQNKTADWIDFAKQMLLSLYPQLRDKDLHSRFLLNDSQWSNNEADGFFFFDTYYTCRPGQLGGVVHGDDYDTSKCQPMQPDYRPAPISGEIVLRRAGNRWLVVQLHVGGTLLESREMDAVGKELENIVVSSNADDAEASIDLLLKKQNANYPPSQQDRIAREFPLHQLSTFLGPAHLKSLEFSNVNLHWIARLLLEQPTRFRRQCDVEVEPIRGLITNIDCK